MTTLKEDLAVRLARLDRSWAAMTGQQGQPRSGTATFAGWWAKALTGEGPLVGAEYGTDSGPETAARLVLEHLVPEAEAAGSAFWATELGRMLARQGLAPVNAGGQVPSAVVGAALGFTRSRAHELQQRGRLCTPGQLAEELTRRG
jgi:hypothetical protein